MAANCISGEEITLSCRQFFNPIVPEKDYGYQLTLYDAEVERRIIAESQANLFLDATNYKPMTIPVKNFVIDPANSMIASVSTWTLSMTVNIPMERGCFVKWKLPPEFGYNPQ